MCWKTYYRRAVAQDRSWDKPENSRGRLSVRAMPLSHPDPWLPTSFPLPPVTLLRLCKLLGFALAFSDVVQLPRRHRSARGSFLWHPWEEIDADHSGSEDAPGPKLRSNEEFALAHKRHPRQAAASKSTV